jgi:hypothetical protein
MGYEYTRRLGLMWGSDLVSAEHSVKTDFTLIEPDISLGRVV